MIDFDAINQGFSHEAQVYDKTADANPVIRWARALVRGSVVRCLPPQSSILEINAGTGLDAAWLVEQGHRVHATDIADGMLAAIDAKIRTSKTPDRFTMQRLSFTELEKTDNTPFDTVFSNFGGLNCVPDLSLVTHGLQHVLKPGGSVVLVIMPPVCPWELAGVFRGRWHTAVNRLKRGGVMANISGSQVRIHYFTPKQVRQALGQDFEVESLQSFSLFCPPMFMVGFSKRFPRLTKGLMWLDERLGRLPILNGCGDFFILTARLIRR
jgi:ubiquinone/menaquinone biosynthesis C-methylase UbiE